MEKVEALLNRPGMTTNWGSSSVRWRGQLWQPKKLGFQRMTRSLYGRGYCRFLNQVGIDSLHRCLMVWEDLPDTDIIANLRCRRKMAWRRR